MPNQSIQREYADAANVLTDWFISQEIPMSKACGIMMFLTGACIGEQASSEDSLTVGIKLHTLILGHYAEQVFHAKR